MGILVFGDNSPEKRLQQELVVCGSDLLKDVYEHLPTDSLQGCDFSKGLKIQAWCQAHHISPVCSQD